MSFHTEAILWETHRDWFAEKLADSGSLLFVVENDDANPVGQVRFDRDQNGDYEIDISVARNHRGNGIGREMLALAVEGLIREHPECAILARVKRGNHPSIALFRSAGFRQVCESEEGDFVLLKKRDE